MRIVVIAVAMLWASAAFAQPTTVLVRGGAKPLREQVIALLAASSGEAARKSARADVTIALQKKGGAKVSCTGATAFVPGPSAAEIVAQFRAWLPGALEARRVAREVRAEVVRQSLLAAVEGFNQGLAIARAATPTTASAPLVLGPKLLVFGGDGHRTFLGCVNCGKYDADSMLNPYGLHGSRYGVESVLNLYSEFGSRYGIHSACNPYSLDPPVIVDEGGTFYGRLTVNTSHLERTTNPETRAWIASVCAG